MECIHTYIIQTYLTKLPLCDDLCSLISQYLIAPPPKVCQLLACKLIFMGNVKNEKERPLYQYAIRLDKCKALIKHFDTLWDKFSTFLTSEEDKKVIEHWHFKLIN
jgi:hypothetical protein